MTEAAVLCGLLQLRPRIGNGHKIPSGGVADGVGDARKKIIHQNIRLERRPGFAGNNESCACDVDAALEAPHLIRVGGIEHMQLGMAGRRSQALGQHLGAETRSAHAEEENIAETALAQLLAEVAELGGVA